MRIDHQGRLQMMLRTARALLAAAAVTSRFVDAIEVARRSADTSDLCRLNDIDTFPSRALKQKRVEAVTADRSAVCMTAIEASRHFGHDSPLADHPRDLANRWTSTLADPRTQAEFVQQLQAGRP
ncbi:MAG: hypothetical protein WAM21_11810 [Steroidobacteraceae bacterium]